MGTVKKAGPTALTTAAADLLNGGGGSASMRDRLKHIHVTNKGAADATFSMYIGLTGGSLAGTEMFKGQTVAVGESYDWYGDLPLSSTEFLSALASANTTLVAIVEYEREVV